MTHTHICIYIYIYRLSRQHFSADDWFQSFRGAVSIGMQGKKKKPKEVAPALPVYGDDTWSGRANLGNIFTTLLEDMKASNSATHLSFAE